MKNWNGAPVFFERWWFEAFIHHALAAQPDPCHLVCLQECQRLWSVQALANDLTALLHTGVSVDVTHQTYAEKIHFFLEVFCIWDLSILHMICLLLIYTYIDLTYACPLRLVKDKWKHFMFQWLPSKETGHGWESVWPFTQVLPVEEFATCVGEREASTNYRYESSLVPPTFYLWISGMI